MDHDKFHVSDIGKLEERKRRPTPLFGTFHESHSMKCKSTSLFMSVVVIVPFVASGQVQNAKDTDERPKSTAVEMQGTPEAALRQFMWSRMTRSADALTEVVLQQEYLERMLKGGPVDAEETARVKEDLSTIEIRSLKVGHKINLAGGKTFELTESHVNENRRQLATPRNPFPYDMVRIDGKWKVNLDVRRGEPPPEQPPTPKPPKPSTSKPQKTEKKS